jgi:hypothetical protein
LANAGVNLSKRHRGESDNGPAAFDTRTCADPTPGCSDWKEEETRGPRARSLIGERDEVKGQIVLLT